MKMLYTHVTTALATLTLILLSDKHAQGSSLGSASMMANMAKHRLEMLMNREGPTTAPKPAVQSDTGGGGGGVGRPASDDVSLNRYYRGDTEAESYKSSASGNPSVPSQVTNTGSLGGSAGTSHLSQSHMPAPSSVVVHPKQLTYTYVPGPVPGSYLLRPVVPVVSNTGAIPVAPQTVPVAPQTTAATTHSIMRPMPETNADVMADRNREAAQSAYDRWLASLLGASYWNYQNVDDKQGDSPSLTTAPADTTTTTTPPASSNSNYFNSDGSVNYDRVGMIKMPTETEDVIRDRTAAQTAADLLLSRLTGNYFSNTANRGRTSEGNSVPVPKAPQAVVPLEGTSSGTINSTHGSDDANTGTSNSNVESVDNTGSVNSTNVNNDENTANDESDDNPPMYDKPYKEVPEDFLNTNYTESTDDSTGNSDAPLAARSSSNAETPQAYFDDEGKMYQGEVYSNTLDASSTKLDSVNGKKSSKATRKRRQTGQGPTEEQAIACQTPSNFAACQFYPTCFSSLNKQCEVRESFIGDDYSSFCYDLQAIGQASETDVLRNFIDDLLACVDETLLEVVGYTSCDDVTEDLTRALLVDRAENCIARSEHFCELLETPTARYSLALLFAEPRGREMFLLELVVSLGNQANQCSGPGANIFLLDLMSQVMRTGTTYQLPGGQPMPVFEP